MLLNSRNRIPRYCLGELLLESGAVSATGLKDCALIAKKANAPIGRALVMTGQVSELDLDNALKTQRAIRTSAICERLAKQLLRCAHAHQVTIEEAYKLNDIKMENGPLSRLAKLLLAADLVNEFGMKQAMGYAEKTCYPIGQSLIHLEYITESTLVNCFNLQILIRDGHLSFYDAVRALRAIEKEGRSFESLLVALGLRHEESAVVAPRIGELLVAANLMTREDSLVLAELGIECDLQYGQLLAAYNLVPSYVVEAAIQLQQMFSNPKFTFEQAARVLYMVKATECSLEEVLEQIDSIRLAIRVLQSASADTSDQAKLIVEEEANLETALVNDYEITIAEAIIVNHVENLGHVQSAMHLVDSIQGDASFTETVTRVLAEMRNEQMLQRIAQQAA